MNATSYQRVMVVLAVVTVLSTDCRFMGAAERQGAWGRNKKMYAVPAPKKKKE